MTTLSNISLAVIISRFCVEFYISRIAKTVLRHGVAAWMMYMYQHLLQPAIFVYKYLYVWQLTESSWQIVIIYGELTMCIINNRFRMKFIFEFAIFSWFLLLIFESIRYTHTHSVEYQQKSFRHLSISYSAMLSRSFMVHFLIPFSQFTQFTATLP